MILLVAAGEPGKTEDAIAVGDDIIRRFGNNDSPGISGQVAKAQFLRRMLLKQ